MSIPKEAYSALQSIVGPEWVSNDPAICEADRIQPLGQVEDAVRPACSIEPATGEEVQKIVQVANKFKIPFIATSTFLHSEVVPRKENTILIDLKRMRKFEIDNQNMYAVIEPGVCYAALQSELLKRGLVTFVSGAGGQTSALANTITYGDAPIGWRYGLGNRRLLAVEWILPNGKKLMLGSRSTSKEFFWGEGPGPDLRGILRGTGGWISKLGVVTKIGIKVFPFVTEKLEPEGWAFHTHLKLPENRLKWYNLRFQTRQDTINAIAEMGRSEIGLVVMTVPPMFRAVARSRGLGCAGFWQAWKEIGAKLNPNQYDVRVLLFGIGSSKRLAYEEKVLLDIVAENKGLSRSAPATDETNIMAADAICANVVGGRFQSEVSYESIHHGAKFGDVVTEMTNRHKPPILEEYGTTNWLCPYDLCHMCKIECLRTSAAEDFKALGLMRQDCSEVFLKKGAYYHFADPAVFSPVWGNFQKRNDKIKEAFDPDNISNPE